MVYRIAYNKEPGWFLLHFVKPAMTFVGSESLDHHPPPPPSVHCHHLVPQLKRPLLSSEHLGAKLLTPYSCSRMWNFSWTRSFGVRLVRPLHTPLPPRIISIWAGREQDEETRKIAKLQPSSSQGTEPNGKASMVWFWAEVWAVDSRKLQLKFWWTWLWYHMRFVEFSSLVVCVCV